VALGEVGATDDVKRSVLEAYAQTGRRGAALV
jgi:hypothetical protein